MTAEDAARVRPVHMEAINHRLLTRDELRSYLEREGFSEQTLIPADGERMSF